MKLTEKQHKALVLVEKGLFYPTLVEEEDGWHARWRAVDPSGEGSSLDGWVDIFLREATMTCLTEEAESKRHETLHDAWMDALQSRTGLVRWDADECRAFAAELNEWNGSAASDVAARRAIVFDWQAEARADGAMRLFAPIPRTRAAFRALGQATFVWEPLVGLRRDGDHLTLTLSRAEADDFVLRGASSLREAGYGVQNLPVRASVTAEAEVMEAKAEKIKLVVHVAGEAVTAEEVRFLLDQGSSLVFFRNRWIEVDRAILKAALRALERGVEKKASALSFMMGIGHVGALEVEGLKTHGWARGLVESLRRHGALEAARVPKSFVGTLRDYQIAGFVWLAFMTEHGLGALLADDMGLGKTVETIAWILKAREKATRPVLVVAPLTLLSNWAHEIATFAPSFRVYRHQGEARLKSFDFREAAEAADIVLTSYSLVVRDQSSFASVAWDALVLDEAQAVKNPDTQMARAVKSLAPRKRIALTGTPIENSVMDLWALEDFLNPGFLGDARSFRERFARLDAFEAASPRVRRLRHALEPFVLRRLKTDRAIAAELGEKREVREWCALGEEARRAYEAALTVYRESDHAPGDMFALLTRLKLVCDGVSPGVEPLSLASSGKFLRLVDLLSALFEAGESALVFTQYAKVGAALQTALKEHFKVSFPFLHGALSPKQREAEIARFNHRASVAGTAFILSLKAGGYGLNLTKATHVIHYDRWWNPAVENQATDRAYRIGQSKNVFVHLMMTEGTLEESIDRMLLKKTSLKELVADGEAFWKAVKLI